MAETGDPPPPQDPVPDEGHDDDLIGFASPASLVGRRREDPAPVEPEPDLFPAPKAEAEAPPSSAPEPTPVPEAAPEPGPAGSIFEPSPEFSTRRPRRNEPPPLEGGGMGLFAVYALILFSVPTFGVAAVIALFAVTGRSGPTDRLGHSHFVYQQRTLWTAAIAALLGIILIVVNVGVFVLFVLALWVLTRGAYGVWRLKAGEAIANPRGWLF